MNTAILPDSILNVIDKFELDWFCQNAKGTLEEKHRKDVEAAIYDHEALGNWDIALNMRKFKYQKSLIINNGQDQVKI